MANNMHRVSLPKKLYTVIEENVANLYEEYALKVPINPYILADKMDFIVGFYSQRNISEQALNQLRGNGPERRKGISFFNPDIGTYEILINDVDYKNDKMWEYTICHEIGHIRMGHKTDSLLAETIANYYAAYLLVPSPISMHFKCSTFLDMADVFDVSTECAYYCFQRTSNREQYGGGLKAYEKKILSLHNID